MRDIATDKSTSAQAELAGMAQIGGNALFEHRENVLAPDERKALRQFSPAEVASYLGITPTYLRRLHADGIGPEVAKGANGQRSYTGQDMRDIRSALVESLKSSGQDKQAARYVRGRRGEDKLQVIAIANFKGGSAKTTTSVHVAQYFALMGYRVLAVDCDSQGSLTNFLDVNLRPVTVDDDGDPTIYDAIRYDSPMNIADCCYPTYFPGLDVAPATLVLDEYEFEVPAALTDGRADQEVPFWERLRLALEPVEDRYDLVILDCPPRLSYLTLTAIGASTACLIPCPPSMLDVHSTVQFLRMAASLLETLSQNGADIRFDFAKILLTKVRTNDASHQNVCDFLRQTYGPVVMENIFVESGAISDVTQTSETLFEVNRTQLTRTTYDRAMSSVAGVCEEIEKLIHTAWGRSHGA